MYGGGERDMQRCASQRYDLQIQVQVNKVLEMDSIEKNHYVHAIGFSRNPDRHSVAL